MMSLMIKTGERFELNPKEQDLSKVTIGFGWKAHKQGGFLKNLLKGEGECDLDAAAILLNQKNKLEQEDDVIYFGNLHSYTGNVYHTGDSVDGKGKGHDEAIIADLIKLPENYKKIILAIVINKATERQQNFGMLDTAFIELLDGKNTKLVNYQFITSETDQESVSMLAGELVRQGKTWQFNALGKTLSAKRISSIAAQFA
ncbi:TerD family protein [Deltaproteobacteria bacterium TL4]